MKSDGIYKLHSVPGRKTIEGLTKRVSDADPHPVETYLHMLKASNDFLAALDSHFSRYQLSRGRFFTLMTLLSNQDVLFTPADIADRLGVSRATITGLLDGLEREHLIERRRFSSDRRRVAIHLTPKAHKLLDDILPDHFRRVSAFMSCLTLKEQRMLCKLLDKMGSGLTAFQVQGASPTGTIGTGSKHKKVADKHGKQ